MQNAEGLNVSLEVIVLESMLGMQIPQSNSLYPLPLHPDHAVSLALTKGPNTPGV